MLPVDTVEEINGIYVSPPRTMGQEILSKVLISSKQNRLELIHFMIERNRMIGDIYVIDRIK